MKVEISMVGDGPESFEGFADRHGLVLDVKERGAKWTKTSCRYYAQFRGSETKDGAFFEGTYGNGFTPQEAIHNYKAILAGRLLVIDGLKPERREIQCPTEWLS